MKSLITRSATPIGALIAAALLMIAVAVIVMANISHAGNGEPGQDGRLVTIHDRGTEKVILTQAETVGDALTEAGVALDPKDTVEPSASQKLVASDYQVNIYRARPVIVVDGVIKQKIVTPYQTAPQIVKDAGIKLYPEDTTKLERVNDIVAEGAGLRLTIDRATPFKFTLYGETITARTQAATVGDMLVEKGIKLGANDRVSVDKSTPITSDLSVRVWREGKQTLTVDEDVDFATDKISDANREVGYREIRTPGEKGSRSVTYEIEIQDGKEVARTEIASIVTKQPKTQVEVVGVKVALRAGYSADRVAIMNAAGISPSDQGYAAYIIDHENASWCPTRWQGQIGCPASYYPTYSESSHVGYGLCQATPGNKMASAGSDWRTNPVTQMKWCSDYAIGRYGSWLEAYKFKVNRGWW